MQKHWYIIYTRPKLEKKVAGWLTKRKIENFLPVRQTKSSRWKKALYEPLFDSYVFAYIAEDAVRQLKQIEGAVSLVYWKGHPATIKENEIQAIRKLTDSYQDITVIRSEVNMEGEVSFMDSPAYNMDGKVLSVKNKSIKINLPSLGYVMIAEMESDKVIGREVAFGKNEFLYQ